MTDWSTLKKLIWLHIVKGGGGGIERTVKGAIVHVINALARPAISVKCEVNPIQDLHGYDSPWPAGGGKNLFDFDQIVGTTTIETSSILLQPGTYYVYVAAKSPNFNSYVQISSDGTSFSIIGTDSSALTAYADKTMGYNQRKCILTVVSAIYCRQKLQVNSNVQNARIAVMYTTDSTGYSSVPANMTYDSPEWQAVYRPYSNICPISGRTSATVTRTGKNLLNSGFCLNRTLRGLKTVVNDDGSITLTGTAEAATRYWNSANTLGLTLAAGTYTLSPSNLRLEKSGATMAGTFTLSEEATFSNVYWSGFTSGEVVNTVVYPQLELGSTASAYEPYQGNTYTIALGDTVYGGTLDVTGGKMVVDRAIVTLDGTQSISASSNNKFYRNIAGAKKINASNQTTDRSVFCDKAKSMSWADLNYGNIVGTSMCCAPVYGNGIAWRWENITSVEDWTSYFSNNPTQFSYELATPLEITLTPTQIEMLLGENNLWADAGDSTLTYYADGNASASEALGILLGGTYNNHGGADDVSDDEALGILLGGS